MAVAPRVVHAYSFMRNACFNRSSKYLDFFIGISSAIPPGLRRHSIRGCRSFQGVYGFSYAGFRCNVGSKADMTTKFQSRKCHDKISSQCDLTIVEEISYDNSLMTQTESFEAFVDRFLLLNKSSVKNFFLSISSLSVVSRISEWVSYAVNHNVQSITVHVDIDDPVKVIKGLSINLSDNLFTCKSLTVLNMVFGFNFLQLPSVIYLPNLKELSLECLILYDEQLAANFFSSCPLLEKLYIDNFGNNYQPKCLIISHPQLKVLTVKCFSTEGYLNISTPALAKFTYCGSQIDMIIEHMPSLTAASITFSSDEVSGIDGVPKLFSAISTTKELELSYYFHRLRFALPEPNVVSCLPTLWPRLNKLEILVASTALQYRVLASFLKSSPCLICLYIEFSELYWMEIGEKTWDIKEEFSLEGDSVANLEMVHISNLDDGEGQMEMIRILIENANSLKYIHLGLSLYYKSYPECWTEFFYMLPTFTKASKHDIHVKFMAPGLESKNTIL